MPSTLYVSVRVVCPACGADKKFSSAPIDRCRSCGAEYPVELRQSAEASLARQKAPRPALLTVGMYISGALGVSCLLGMACAAVDVGQFYLNNVQVSGPQFLAVAGLPLTVIGLTALGIAYSLFRNWWASRLLIVIACTADVLIAVVAALVIAEHPWRAVVQTLVPGTIVVGPIAAYLFFNRKVAAYYDARRPVKGENRGRYGA